MAAAPRALFISSVRSSIACSSSSLRFVRRWILAATSAAFEFVNHSLGPPLPSKPNVSMLPTRPKTLSKRPPAPFTTIPSSTLKRFSGRSKMASIRLPTASSMLTTRSSIHLSEISSVMESSTPVTKFLMPFDRSSISFGICATMPITLPMPPDSTLSILPPILPSVLPIVFDSVAPIFFAIPSPIWGSMESSVPFSWSICPTDCRMPPKPSAPCQPLALLSAVVRPLVKFATSSEVRFSAVPKSSMFSRAVAVASPSS